MRNYPVDAERAVMISTGAVSPGRCGLSCRMVLGVRTRRVVRSPARMVVRCGVSRS